jgi:hypothetical protein
MTAAEPRLAQAAMANRDTKVSELCAELGITRQTLYRYVDPKGNLRPDGLKLLGGQKAGATKHHHRYEVTFGRVLFDDRTVEIRYGRSRRGSHGKQFDSPKPDGMKGLTRDRLRRRPSAPKRIGCPDRLAAFSVAAGFEASPSLPGDIMARFFEDMTGG